MSRLWMVVYWVVAVGLLGCGSAQAADVKKAELPRLVVQTGHSEGVLSIAFSPDGKTLVSGGKESTLKLWNVSTGRELRTLAGHILGVRSVAFSPNGKIVVSGSEDTTIKLWDVTSGQVLRTFAGHGHMVRSVAFSPDGKTVVSGSFDKTLKLWDVASGRELRTFAGHKNYVMSVAFSPDGKTVVSGSVDGTIKFWDVATGQEMHTIAVDGGAGSVSFSPDGKIVMSETGGKSFKLWDAATSRELRTFAGHSESLASLAFSPDGKNVVSGSDDKTIKLWNVASGHELRTLTGHSESLASVAFSPDSKIVASASWDNTIKLWNATTGVELRTLAAQGSMVASVAFSADSKTLGSESEHGLNIWDVATGRELRTLVNHGRAMRGIPFSPDIKTVVSETDEETLKLWDVTTGRELLTFAGHVKGAQIITYFPDGKTLLSVSSEASKLWDVATGRELRTFVGYEANKDNSVAVAPDGKIVATGGEGKTFKLWDVATGRELHTLAGHQDKVEGIAFSPDGKTVISGSADKTLKLWDVATGQELRTFAGHGWQVSSVAFSSDGKTVVSGSVDQTLKLWDVATGKEMRTFVGHEFAVTSVAFSPDGKTVVSGSYDKTIKLWRVSDGTLLATLTSFTDGRWAVTDPEGRFDTADLEDMPYLHWVMPDDPMTPLPLEIFMRDYYEPRLLPRILNGEKFKPVRALGELNRVQPEVKITSIEPDSETGYVKVNVEANVVSRAYGFSDKKITTAAHDLRLFRNGQMVGYAEGKLSEAGGKPFQRSFRVRLPSGKAPLNFTAYAFNDDRVKSTTAQQSYTPPSAIVVGKPRAYLITVGVNHHDNPAWNLRYAANDARQIGQSVAPLLQNQKSYEEVVAVPLISDSEGHDLATKAYIKAVLDVLAGRKADVSALPGGDKLRQASPDDLVLISFSGHGYGDGGLFYLIPGDTGTGSGREITPELTAHAISSDELSAWLRDVDAGDMAMIVDACHSAASVGDEFKPGPMGSRGLGQLAFDKGMRILAASQADDVALESDLIKQGLLSFALVENGLESQQADFKPKDKKITLEEWLSYGVNRVPSLADEVKSGTVIASRGAVRTAAGELKKKRVIQQPALFDFTKGRRDVVLEAGLK